MAKKKNLSYTARAQKHYRMRAERVIKFRKLLNQLEPEIAADQRYFRQCEQNQLTKQEVLNMRKRQRQHTNKLNMREFYQKKIRVNTD